MIDMLKKAKPTIRFVLELITRDPLRVVGEVEHWVGHTPEQLQAMKDGLARLNAEGAAHIID